MRSYYLWGETNNDWACQHKLTHSLHAWLWHSTSVTGYCDHARTRLGGQIDWLSVVLPLKTIDSIQDLQIRLPCTVLRFRYIVASMRLFLLSSHTDYYHGYYQLMDSRCLDIVCRSSSRLNFLVLACRLFQLCSKSTTVHSHKGNTD